jgi:hypothetical protein
MKPEMMKPEIEKVLREETNVSIPFAGAVLGNLGRNGSYAAARRGEIPVLKFGSRRRVPTEVLRKMLGVQDRPAEK